MIVFRTIKAKLFFSFGMFIAITGLVILASFWFDSQRNRIDMNRKKLQEINLKVKRIALLENDFLSYETVNPDFYRLGTGVYLARHDSLLNVTKADLLNLQESSDIRSEEILDEINTVITLLDSYEKKFKELVVLTRRRGFEDYGLEGKMRDFIHKIEYSGYPFDYTTLLMIRRHEKDFFLRKKSVYIGKLQKAVKKMEKQIIQDVKNEAVREQMLRLMNNYTDTFTEIVLIEKEIGYLSASNGVREQLSSLTRGMVAQIGSTNAIANERAKVYQNRNDIILSSIMIFCLLLVLILAYIVTRSLSRPVIDLSESIHRVIKQDFDSTTEIVKVNTDDEIGKLSKDFRFMLEQVQAGIAKIKEKNEEVERSKEHIMDSIRYAKTIQEAILPGDDELKAYFPDFFVIYRPQHLVSGDFYWFFRKKKRSFVAVVDCTGHGVPGAFMSMIGNALLTKIVGQSKIYDPALILEVLNIEIQTILHQDENKNSDGMDLCICMLEKNDLGSAKLTFAGAKSQLYIGEPEGEVRKIRGSKKSVGGNKKHKGHEARMHSFENIAFDISKGTRLYLTTDGFIDQNDAERKRYGSKKFLAKLNEIHSKPLDEQFVILTEELDKHQGEELQRDDITVLALEI